jgi:hypothetical protein
MRLRFLPVLIGVVLCSGATAFAQTGERRQSNSNAQAAEPPPSSLNGNALDSIANQIDLLRKSLQALNTRLREISDKLSSSGAGPVAPANDKQNRIAANLELLAKAEQRAEGLRKQLFELIEKETSLRGRLVQLDEESRPDNIERSLSGVGTTRTVELRDTRRKVLENDKRGSDTLLSQVSQSRVRLEEDVRQADQLVTKLRQRILPLIEKEIEKINPN